MKTFGRLAASALILLAIGFGLATGEVVVLRGGARIELKKPPVRQGSIVLLTRSDGTLLSVRDSDVDWTATAAARAAKPADVSAPASPAPPETPAEASKAGGRGPKARVKLTDADVSHTLEGSAESVEKEKKETSSAPALLEVVDYKQEKAGSNLAVQGSIRNSGGTPAVGSRMTVTALDEKGEKIASGEAGLSNSLVEPGASVSFSATIPVADRFVGSLRFAPQWIAPAAPAAAPTPPAAATPAAARPAAQSPPPAPTPYGLGSLYAPPSAPASTTPPADGNRGYIPGMSSPENQPKPPK